MSCQNAIDFIELDFVSIEPGPIDNLYDSEKIDNIPVIFYLTHLHHAVSFAYIRMLLHNLSCLCSSSVGLILKFLSAVYKIKIQYEEKHRSIYVQKLKGTLRVPFDQGTLRIYANFLFNGYFWK